MIDDDEEIDRSWFVRINEIFADDELDFIGRPICATLGRAAAHVAASRYSGVIGAFNLGSERGSYGADTVLPGGNAVVGVPPEKVDAILHRLGPRGITICRRGQGYVFETDRLGAKGLYLPDLVVITTFIRKGSPSSITGIGVSGAGSHPGFSIENAANRCLIFLAFRDTYLASGSRLLCRF